MVARLDLASVSLAQKPKSAAETNVSKSPRERSFGESAGRRLTNLDIATGVQEDVVALDVTVDDILAVKMGKTFACLQKGQHLPSTGAM